MNTGIKSLYVNSAITHVGNLQRVCVAGKKHGHIMYRHYAVHSVCPMFLRLKISVPFVFPVFEIFLSLKFHAVIFLTAVLHYVQLHLASSESAVHSLAVMGHIFRTYIFARCFVALKKEKVKMWCADKQLMSAWKEMLSLCLKKSGSYNFLRGIVWKILFMDFSIYKQAQKFQDSTANLTFPLTFVSHVQNYHRRNSSVHTSSYFSTV